MKKLCVWIVAAALMICGAGCGKGDVKSNAASTGDIPTLLWYLPGEEQSDSEAVMKEVNEILMKKIGCKLQLKYLNAGVYTERMTMNMASGEKYDLCFTGYVNPYVKAARVGGLLAIDEYLAKCPELMASIPDYAMKAAKVDGKIYAIPNMQVMANSVGLFMQKKLVEEYGLKLQDIHYLNDIEPFLQWVKEKYPNLYPLQIGQPGGFKQDLPYKLVGEITKGVSVIKENGEIKVKSSVELEGTINEARLMSDYFKKGFIRQDISFVTDDTNEANANKYAAWRGVYKPGAAEEFESIRKTGIVAVQLSEPTIPFTAGRTTMTGVGRNTKYPEKAVKVIEAMNTNPELYNLVCFGIKDKHYKMTDTKHLAYIENSGYQPGSAWRFGNQFNALLLPGQEDAVWEKTKSFNNSADVSELLGFNFDNTRVRTEMAQMETIYGKFTPLYKGFMPLEDYYDEMKAELYKAGMETVIAEVKVQLEQFFAKK